VLRIKGLKLSGDHKDVTSHLSGGWTEKLAVMKEAGGVTFLVHFDKTDGTLDTTTGIAAAALAQTVEKFQLTFADGTGFSFSALVGVEFNQPVRGKVIGNVILDITGPVVVI
jgi:predicted secreted protein